MLDVFPWFSEHTDPTYLIMNDKWNNDYSRRYEDYKEFFDYDGLHFYNERNVIERLDKASQFDVSFRVDFSGLLFRNLIRFVKELKAMMDYVIAKSFGGDARFGDITIINEKEYSIKLPSHARMYRMDSVRINDFVNRLDNPATKKALGNMMLVLFGAKHGPMIDACLTGRKKFSTQALLLAKLLKIRPEDWFMSETDQTIFVEVPKNETLKMNTWLIRRFLEIRDKGPKYILLTIEGTLSLDLWYVQSYQYDHSTAKEFERFMENCVFSTINNLEIRFEYTDKDYKVNLMKFHIRDCKITFKGQPYRWMHQKKILTPNYKIPEVLFLEKPAKLKIIDKSNEL